MRKVENISHEICFHSKNSKITMEPAQILSVSNIEEPTVEIKQLKNERYPCITQEGKSYRTMHVNA